MFEALAIVGAKGRVVGPYNACTRVPIHFSDNLKMKNENFSSFSFFIFAEN